MKRTLLYSLVIFVLAMTSACSTGRANPQTSANNLFFDNFAKTDSGWTRLQSESVISDYGTGFYHMYIKSPGTLILANPGKVFAGDVSIEVDARKTGGADDNYFGVLCHYQNPDNYYMFLITSDGYSGIAMRKAGQDVLLSPGLKFLKMKGIKTGGATNHIRADCVGESLSLYANGVQVSQAYDTQLTGGDVGLAVRSGKLLGDTDVRFNNFTVNNPTP